ncbi:MAG: hypothetical protein JW795_23130, partial [Chitinivibrionales bacterium]|nr:hypothetical protein [Chitinivibrionales bacterium]
MMPNGEWIYLDTYIEDTFDQGTAKDWWNDSFRTTWHFNSQYPPGSGDCVAVQRGSVFTKLTKAEEACYLQGDFDLQCGLKFGENNHGNNCVSIVLMKTHSDVVCRLLWYADKII